MKPAVPLVLVRYAKILVFGRTPTEKCRNEANLASFEAYSYN